MYIDMYTAAGAFTGMECFVTKRIGCAPAQSKVIVAVHGPIVERMRRISRTPCLDQGPAGRDALVSRITDEIHSWIDETVRRYGLPGYVGFECRQHQLRVFLAGQDDAVDWVEPRPGTGKPQMYALERPFEYGINELGVATAFE